MVLGYKFSDGGKPLTGDERDRVIEAAKNSPAAAKVAVFLILYSGLRAKEASHVTSDMVSVISGSKLKIALPSGENQCQIVGPDRKRMKGFGLGGVRSCNRCENGTYEFESPRTVPVVEEAAVDVISDWFGIYDYMPSHRSMLYLLDDVGEEAGVERLKLSVLRHSFGVLLAAKGFSRREIEKIMGINTETLNNGVVLSYGRLCEGSNPFMCGGETELTDGPCEKVVEKGRCYYHSE